MPQMKRIPPTWHFHDHPNFLFSNGCDFLFYSPQNNSVPASARTGCYNLSLLFITFSLTFQHKHLWSSLHKQQKVVISHCVTSFLAQATYSWTIHECFIPFFVHTNNKKQGKGWWTCDSFKKWRDGDGGRWRRVWEDTWWWTETWLGVVNTQ